MGARARIGTSGYQYEHWRGVLYPEGAPKDEWFRHYAERFDTVEINNTFYHLPEASTFDKWRREAPEGFCYALKFSRYATHMKKLRDPAASIAQFMERAERLEETLGPILVQLPPRWRVNPERLDAFLDAAPAGRRWAVEFRDPSWFCRPVYEVLARHGAALCIHDMIENHPRVTTAEWVYLRFHGDGYTGSYSRHALSGIARRIRRYLAEGRDVYCYFNNDAHGYAVYNAQDLRRYLSGP
jgi:uncharacterized protein YecE (DUF72 family)